MKILKKIITTCMVLCLSMFLFSGCTYRKYELIGIIKEGDTEVTKLADITDEGMRNYLNESYQNSLYIKLNNDATYEMGYTQVDGNTTVSVTHTGTYDLSQKTETINFYEPKENGEQRKVSHQYSNNMIIYFDGTIHLVLK